MAVSYRALSFFINLAQSSLSVSAFFVILTDDDASQPFFAELHHLLTNSILSVSAFYHGFPTFVLSFSLRSIFRILTLNGVFQDFDCYNIELYQACRRMLPLDLPARNLAKDPGFQR